MKRRSFLQGIAASAGAVTLPLPAAAKAATVTTKVTPFHYGWACVYAQMNNGVSAADISRVFKIPMSDAHGLMDRMLTRGVIHPAGLDGRSHPTRAWQPWDRKQAIAAEQERRAANEAKNRPDKANNVIPFYYGWACVYARSNTSVSAADLSRVFGIPAQDAKDLLQRMLDRGIVQPAGSDGRCAPVRIPVT